MFTPFGTYDNAMTLMLLVGFSLVGLTAGGSTKRGKPLPLPLIVGSTQSWSYELASEVGGLFNQSYLLLALQDLCMGTCHSS